MASPPVSNPEIPYVGAVEKGLSPGILVNVRGKVPENAVRFAINYQLGPNLNPRDDIALHLSPRFNDGIITRNHIRSMSWGPEENSGGMWIQPGQNFEIIILCEPLQYRIAINGRHYAEFAHRLPYQNVTHLVIDGDVEISSIHYESIHQPPRPAATIPPDVSAPNFGPPSAGGIYPTIGPQAPPGGYYPTPPMNPSPYGPSGGHIYRPEKEEEEESGFGLDKVGLAVGGLIAAGGVAAAMHAMNKKKDTEEDHSKSDTSPLESGMGLGGLGALGAALASSLASNALQGDSRQSQGYPPQDSGPGGMLGSILGSLGGGGAGELPGFPSNKHGGNDPLGDLGGLGGLGSILGGVLGKGGHQQPAYEPSGGYSSHSQGDSTSNLINGIGGALFSSALDSLTKHKSRGDDRPSHGNDYPPSFPQNPPSYPQHPSSYPQNPPQYEQNYGPRDGPQQPYHQPRAATPPSSGNDKLSAADISKGLGLGDDED